MKTAGTIGLVLCVTFGAVALFLVFFYFSGYPEGYCYFYPSIDTQYADGYVEEDFTLLTQGMTVAQVDAAMCSPLFVYTNSANVIEYWYTSDGKALIGDFAWFARGVEFSNGVATEIIDRTYYD